MLMRQVEIVEKNYNWPPPSPAVLWIQNVEWKKNQIEKKTTNKSKTIKVKLLCIADSKETSPPGAIFPGFSEIYMTIPFETPFWFYLEFAQFLPLTQHHDLRWFKILLALYDVTEILLVLMWVDMFSF